MALVSRDEVLRYARTYARGRGNRTGRSRSTQPQAEG